MTVVDSLQKNEVLDGMVCKLDRKFPLVQLSDGRKLRCELATNLKKRRGAGVQEGDPSRSDGADSPAQLTIGDAVEVSVLEGHDVGRIDRILPRRSEFLRRDPVDRALSQTLAANFDRVLIMHPVDRLNPKRLERELVLAHSAGADVVVVMTKKDLVDEEELVRRLSIVGDLAGSIVDVMAISAKDPSSIEGIRNKLTDGSVSIMIGSSGAGKSTLVNALLGSEVRATSEVRSSDGKGRHKTVSREMIELPSSSDEPGSSAPAFLVDMPGVRGLGLWDSLDGVESAFPDILSHAAECRFRDCSHKNEPGCAVTAAVEKGEISTSRVESYLAMIDELDAMASRRERASWRK